MKTKIKLNFFMWVAFIIIYLFIGNNITHASDNYISELFSNNNIKVVKSDDVDFEYPKRANTSNISKDVWLKYRIDNVVPYAEDKHSNAYLVYPNVWIIVPVLQTSSEDNDLINKWQNFDHLKYLEKWSLWYYGEAPSVAKWNMVIAAHSSYYKSDPGRYKTVFQALPISQKWDIIQYFEKNNEWNYDLYEYEIIASFETPKSNTSILLYNNDDKYYLTTYWCYPLWTEENRWVNQSVLTRMVKNHSIVNENSNEYHFEKSNENLNIWNVDKTHYAANVTSLVVAGPENNKYMASNVDSVRIIDKIVNNINKFIKIDISSYKNTEMDRINILN